MEVFNAFKHGEQSVYGDASWIHGLYVVQRGGLDSFVRVCGQSRGGLSHGSPFHVAMPSHKSQCAVLTREFITGRQPP